MSGETGARPDTDLVVKLRNRLGPQHISSENHAAVSWQQIPALWATVPATTPAGLSLRLAILTAVREDAVIRSRWSEVDLDRRIWNIPAERAKG